MDDIISQSNDNSYSVGIFDMNNKKYLDAQKYLKFQSDHKSN